jgi:hypothetical protein
MPFRVALALHVSPDFTEVETKGSLPPRVNHDEVDFNGLQQTLAATFGHGPAVELCVANDTIDQVTMHTRWGMFPGHRQMPEPKLRCHDFGAAWIALKPRQGGPVADVRAAWSALHAQPVRNRRFAPPPFMIPFMITAEDFEDTAIWVASAQTTIGQVNDESNSVEGRISAGLQAALGKVFGTPFEHHAVIGRIGWDKPPPEFAGIAL